jgi:hypothetical protein
MVFIATRHRIWAITGVTVRSIIVYTIMGEVIATRKGKNMRAN